LTVLYKKVIVHGALASSGLFLIYILIISLAQSFTHAIDEFVSLYYLLIPLIAGFGIQVSLFSYSRQYMKAMRQGSIYVTVSGGLSTASMIACCAHHLTDILPFIGVTAAAIFLTAYQTFFIILGLLSNVIGITVMLALIQRHHMYDPKSALANAMRVDMTKVRNLSLVVSLVIIAYLGWSTASSLGAPNVNSSSGAITLQERVSDANGLVVTVRPSPFSFDSSMSFEIKMDTHSGDLSYDMTKVAYLQASDGQKYLPTEWTGSPPGGHHRDGNLIFPKLSGKPTSIMLVLQDLYGVDRTFEWDLA